MKLDQLTPIRVLAALSEAQRRAVESLGRRTAGNGVEWLSSNTLHPRTERSLHRWLVLQSTALNDVELSLLGRKVWFMLNPSLVEGLAIEADALNADRATADFQRAWLNGCRKNGCFAGATHRITSLDLAGFTMGHTVDTCQAHSQPDMWPHPYRVEPLAGTDAANMAILAGLDAPWWLTVACANTTWHSSAPARRRQRCAECPTPFESDGTRFDGYVAGQCGHRVAATEWKAGFRTCERCGPTLDVERNTYDAPGDAERTYDVEQAAAERADVEGEQDVDGVHDSEACQIAYCPEC